MDMQVTLEFFPAANMQSRTLVIIAVVMVSLGYFFHSPLPDGITDAWTLKIIIGGLRIGNLASRLGSAVGYDTGLNITRRFGGTFALLARPVSDNGLHITSDVFDGVEVRLYIPTARDGSHGDSTQLPAVIYFHGGGFFVLSIDAYDRILREVARETQSIVISVGYRLAPEHPFPTPVNDCYKATVHILTKAHMYGVDSSRVALAGDSSGGNLAAVVAWKLAYDGDISSTLPPVKLQVLLYPMLQAFDFQLPSYVELNAITHELMTIEVLAEAWYMYCTGRLPSNVPGILANNHTSPELKTSKYATYVRSGLDKSISNEMDATQSYDEKLAKEFNPCVTNPLFSPLMADDLSRMPHTYILSAEFDMLLDESYIYDMRLKAAGVMVYHDHRRGGWHGIVSYTRTEGGQKALASVINYIKEHI